MRIENLAAENQQILGSMTDFLIFAKRVELTNTKAGLNRLQYGDFGGGRDSSSGALGTVCGAALIEPTPVGEVACSVGGIWKVGSFVKGMFDGPGVSGEIADLEREVMILEREYEGMQSLRNLVVGEILTPRPHLDGNERYLPKSGDKPYLPPKQKGSPEVIRNPQGNSGGYIDKNGNVWEWDSKGEHWDVQHPDGSHTNVKPDGDIHHGPDNI